MFSELIARGRELSWAEWFGYALLAPLYLFVLIFSGAIPVFGAIICIGVCVIFCKRLFDRVKRLIRPAEKPFFGGMGGKIISGGGDDFDIDEILNRDQ